MMALDVPLPRTVLAHAHWTMDQLKMSKSRGNVVNPFEAIKRFSKDGIRNFLMYRGGLENDADFAESHVERDYRKYLAGQTGNLLQRLESKPLQKKMQQAVQYKGPITDDKDSRRMLELLQGLPGACLIRLKTTDILKTIYRPSGGSYAGFQTVQCAQPNFRGSGRSKSGRPITCWKALNDPFRPMHTQQRSNLGMARTMLSWLKPFPS